MNSEPARRWDTGHRWRPPGVPCEATPIGRRRLCLLSPRCPCEPLWAPQESQEGHKIYLHYVPQINHVSQLKAQNKMSVCSLHHGDCEN